MASANESSQWHWAESDHWEVGFHGLPRRFPWLRSDSPSPPGNVQAREFPMLRLHLAVETMLAEQPDGPHDPRFVGFARQIVAGDELVMALEHGDFIAAEG